MIVDIGESQPKLTTDLPAVVPLFHPLVDANVFGWGKPEKTGTIIWHAVYD